MNQHNDQTVTLMELAATFETCIDFLPPAGRKNISRAVEQLRTYGELCRASAGREAVECPHENQNVGHDSATCDDCGKFRTDSQWGVASCKWFNNRAEAQFFRKNGFLPTAPELPKQGEGGRVTVGRASFVEQAENVATIIGGELVVRMSDLRALAKKAEGAA